MLESLLIYQIKSRELLYSKIFQDSTGEALELFGGFLSALKTFVSDMHISKSKDLKRIELGKKSVFITPVFETETDLVIIGDKEDDKIIREILPDLASIIINNKELFLESDYNLEQFKTFNHDITSLIISNRKIMDETILEKKNDLITSIWEATGEISTRIRNKFIAEKEEFSLMLNKAEYLPKKLFFIEKIIEILETIEDEEELIEYQKKDKILKKELKEIKTKLSYYLKMTKEALKQRNYRDAFSNLYSFSAKLKDMTKPQVQKKYQDLANILLKKDEIDKLEFSQVVSEVSKMPDDIDEYFT